MILRAPPLNSSDEWLNKMRSIGDPPVDALVSEHLARSPKDLGSLLHDLFRTSRMPNDHPLVSAYMQLFPIVDVGDRRRVEQGQRLFELFGPEILLTLGSCALPLAYAAGNGVQVIYRARRLKEDPVRRLCDTAQMVLNVMQPGQLQNGRVGWYSSRKVRLIHALVRHHVQLDPTDPWRADWGTPINQEDQAGTLLTFSVAVLHGLKTMGATISQDDADAYVFAWSEIGRLLGVDDSLLPTNERDGAELASRIGERQIRWTVEGAELANQTAAAVETLFPIKGYGVSLTHFFLENTPFGAKVARTLGLPEPNWTKWLVRLRAASKRAVLWLLNWVPGARRRRSFFARHFAQAMILLRRPDGNAPFAVPDGVLKQWALHEKKDPVRR
jgi:hypothetical protein